MDSGFHLRPRVSFAVQCSLESRLPVRKRLKSPLQTEIAAKVVLFVLATLVAMSTSLNVELQCRQDACGPWLVRAFHFCGFHFTLSGMPYREFSFRFTAASGVVPALVFEPPHAKGTVLVYHGLGAFKEVQRKELAWLAEAGFRAVCLDAPHHGERRDGYLDSLAGSPDPHPGFIRIVRDAAMEIPSIVSTCIETFGGNVAITGISLGGFISFAAVPADRRIRASLPILGSPVWNVAGSNPSRELLWLIEESPVQRPELFPPCALFAANAGRDIQVPPAASRQFLQVLQSPYHATPDRIKYREFEKSEHMMREEDWNDLWKDAIEWLDCFLP